MPEPIYGGSSYTPSYTSSYSGSNNSGSSNNWSGNDWAGEFASAPSNVSYPPPDEDPYDWRTDSDYGGSTYVPTFGNTDEDFASAYGGLSYDWSNNDDFFTDTSGNQIGQPGLGLWNPFIAGFHPETGEPIPLTTSQFNEMMDLGEFPWPLGGSTTTGGGPGPGGGGGYGWGSGGGGGGGRGSGGSRMQFPGAEGAYMRSRWGQPTLQGDYIRRMRGYNRGGIVSLCQDF